MPSLVRVHVWLLLGTLLAPWAGLAETVPGDRQADFARQLDQVKERLKHGRYDEALGLADGVARDAEVAGDPLDAARALQSSSIASSFLGNESDALTKLNLARELAQGTDSERFYRAAIEVKLATLRIGGYREIIGGDLLSNLKAAMDHLNKAELVLSEKSELGLSDLQKSLLKTPQIYFLIHLHQALREAHPYGVHADWPREHTDLLSSALEMEELGAARPSTPSHPEGPKRGPKDGQGAWETGLLTKALELNLSLTKLDADMPLWQAIDISQRGDIQAQLGRLPEGISLKREAVDRLTRLQNFTDLDIALGNLTEMYLAQDTLASRNKALETADRRIDLIEQQALALSGASAANFFRSHDDAYRRLFDLLLERYHWQRFEADPDTNRSLEQLVLQSDRMNFRAVRRDLALYRELAETIGPEGELLHDLNEQAEALRGARQSADTAGGSAAPGRRTLAAKLRLIKVLEDYKRAHLAHQTRAYRLPSSLSEVAEGLSPDDAVIMYVQSPEPEPRLSATVLTAGAPPRWIEHLEPPAGRHLNDMVRTATARLSIPVALGSPELNRVLTDLSKMLWEPLGDLPRNLTIVPTPDLIGVPFEALQSKSGAPVVIEHHIRYAFGLEPGIGRLHPDAAYARALVLGSVADGLTTGEVEQVRGLLAAKGVTVAPRDGLPGTATPLFFESGNFPIVHISTHSDRDPDLAMLDGLKFPQANLVGYELALSRVKGRLVTLSACRLFSPRGEQVAPVSGITIAALARVAPQVISTLWDVNPDATRIFMLRFYDALLKTKEPAAALAAAKRDFLDTPALKQWLQSSGIVPPTVPLEDFRKPFYWAPFVLAVRSED